MRKKKMRKSQCSSGVARSSSGYAGANFLLFFVSFVLTKSYIFFINFCCLTGKIRLIKNSCLVANTNLH
jgi:hypothetical protein